MSVNWSEIIESGIKQFESDLEACFSACEEWVEGNIQEDCSEKDAEYYLAQGMTLQQQQEYSQAISQFTKAIALKPDLSEAYLKRGLSYHALGDIGSAISDFNRVIELNPEQLQAIYYRGALLSYMGDYEKAIADFSKLIEANATANKYYNRGVIYYQTEAYEEAIADLTQAVTVEPEFTAAHFALGNAYYAIDNQSEAQKSYQQGEAIDTEIDQHDEHGCYARAIAARNQGQSTREYFSQAAIAARNSNNLQLGLDLALLLNDSELV